MAGTPMDAGYVEVAQRIQEFFHRYPDGSLQSDHPELIEVAGAGFVLMRAYAYRTPDDPKPGVGTAYEPVPGKTPFTRGSEVQNCETSAWGRALAALGIATKEGVATREDVARQASGQTGGTRKLSRGGSQPASAEQLTALHAALTEAGVKDRDTKLAGISRLLGRDVSSTKELSRDDVATVMDSLKERAR